MPLAQDILQRWASSEAYVVHAMWFTQFYLLLSHTNDLWQICVTSIIMTHTVTTVTGIW